MKFYLSSDVETPFSMSLLEFMKSSDIENGINRLMEFFLTYGVTLGLGKYTITYSGKEAIIQGAGLKEELLLRGFDCGYIDDLDLAIRGDLAYFWFSHKRLEVTKKFHTSTLNRYYISDEEVLGYVNSKLHFYKEKVKSEIQAL
jgi:hypothetical protein